MECETSRQENTNDVCNKDGKTYLSETDNVYIQDQHHSKLFFYHSDHQKNDGSSETTTISVDDEKVDVKVFTSPSSRIRWLAQLAVVMFGMVLNGTVYGYTSPAFVSLVSKDESE